MRCVDCEATMPQTVDEADMMARVAPEPRAWVLGVVERRRRMTVTASLITEEEKEGSFVIKRSGLL